MSDIFVKKDLPSLVKEAKREMQEEKVEEDLTEGQEDLARKWWNSWIAGDMLEREKLIDEVIVDAIMEVFHAKDIDEKMRRHVLQMMMYGYLDDFYETMMTDKYEHRKK
jgi:hypothetical protein